MLVITFMQGIYSYIPETDHVSRVYSVEAVLYLQFVVLVMLNRPWNMFCATTVARSVVCAQCPIRLFFVLPWFRAFLVFCSGTVWVILKWFQLPLFLLSHSTCAAFLLWGLYILRYSQLLSWSHFCLQELQHVLTCIFLFSLSRIMATGLLLGVVLSICTRWLHNMVTLPSRILLLLFHVPCFLYGYETLRKEH